MKFLSFLFLCACVLACLRVSRVAFSYRWLYSSALQMATADGPEGTP